MSEKETKCSLAFGHIWGKNIRKQLWRITFVFTNFEINRCFVTGDSSYMSSSIAAKLPPLTPTLKLAANKNSRKRDVTVTSPGGSGGQIGGWVA